MHKEDCSRKWQCTPVIPALWRLRQEDLEFVAILSHKEKIKKKKKKERGAHSNSMGTETPALGTFLERAYVCLHLASNLDLLK
jgi:hypothetical protein